MFSIPKDSLEPASELVPNVPASQEQERSPVRQVIRYANRMNMNGNTSLSSNKKFCGCGQYYSCTSSLYLHIRTKHGGMAPSGTVGGSKGIVKKSNDFGASEQKIKEEDRER